MCFILFQLYQKYDTNEEEAKALAEKYEDDAEFKPIVKKLQAIYSAVSG